MWTLTALTREALANLYADRWRTLTIVGVFSLLLGGLCLSDLQSASQVRTELQRRDRDGISIIIASAPNGLPASTCDSFNARPDVRAAGGLTTTGVARLATAPSVQIPTATVTAPLTSIWDPQLATRPASPVYSLIGEDLADQLATPAGSALALTNRPPIKISAIYRHTARSDFQARWLVTIQPPTGVVEECWVEFTPGYETAGRGIVAAAFAEPNTTVTTRAFLDLGDHARTLSEDFAQRPTRTATPAVIAICALLTALLTWFRRSELALYRTIGTSRMQLLWLNQIEYAVLLSAAAAAAITWTQLIAELQRRNTPFIPPSYGTTIAIHGVLTATLAIFLASTLTSLLIRGDIARDIKDR